MGSRRWRRAVCHQIDDEDGFFRGLETRQRKTDARNAMMVKERVHKGCGSVGLCRESTSTVALRRGP